MARNWVIEDDDDHEFTGDYDVWINEPHDDGEGGDIIAACYRDHAALIAAAPDLLALVQRFKDFAASKAHFSYPLGSLQEIDAVIRKATA